MARSNRLHGTDMGAVALENERYYRRKNPNKAPKKRDLAMAGEDSSSGLSAILDDPDVIEEARR